MIFYHTSCLGHVINLGNVDVMGHITKIAAVENTTAIWEYDPTRSDNRVLGSLLDIIAAICTLTIKVGSSSSNRMSHTYPLTMLRFQPLGSVSNNSIALKFAVELPNH